MSNGSRIQVIYLTGFPALQQYHSLLFVLLLCIYLFILIGNALIFLIICRESSLHSPMHFFIGQLSCLEIVYTTVTIPKMLAKLLEEKKMSFVGCLIQAYFLHVLGTAECYMLTIMGYDRYLAVCRPLHYTTIMTVELFTKVVIACLIWSLHCPVFEIILISQLDFCGPNCIENYFCDFPLLFDLSCSDTSTIRLVDSIVSAVIMLNFACIVLSYAKIILEIIKIKSKVGRQKAFSTCGSHILVVILFFGSVGFMYVRVAKSYSPAYNIAVGLVFVVFTPFANPVIYGLRNQQIKQSFARHLGSCTRLL